MRTAGLLALLSFCLVASACQNADDVTDPDDPDPQEPTETEILRDTFGVPHVFAPSFEEAAYAWGYVSAEDGRTYPCGYRGTEDLGFYWEMEGSDSRFMDQCHRCD